MIIWRIAVVEESNWRMVNVLLVDTDDSFLSRVVHAFENNTKNVILARAHTPAEARALTAASPCDIPATAEKR